MSKKTSKSDPFQEREAQNYERPIPSREFILDHLKDITVPVHYSELIEALKLSDELEIEGLRRRLKAMVRDDQLERLPGGYFTPTLNRILLKGIVVQEKGKIQKTYIVPEDGSSRVLLSQDDNHAIFNGNRVIVSTVNLNTEQAREGRLIEIIEQQRVLTTGRFVVERGFSHVIPHGKEVMHDILIPQGKENNAQDGDIVVVSLIKQVKRFGDPVGEVIEIIGNEKTNGIEIQSSIRAYNLPNHWSDEVLKEIKKYKENIPEEHKKNRLDLRELPLVTIDGEDSRDFDDAVYCEEKPKGGFTLYVAIADVSFYVKPDTALDAEAKNRGNSVYFPSAVIPMLPEVLSNGLCSLNPNVERLCMVCVLDISPAGKMIASEFHEGLMRSHARLTYTKVAALLAPEQNETLKKEYAHLLPHLHHLYKLYHVLKKEREVRGAIEFETVETRIIFGPDGKINKVEPTQRNDAHRLIEECMLCANVACAQFLSEHKMPALYRNHEGPPEEKLNDLKTFLQELGLSLGGGAKPKPLDYAKLLSSAQNRPDVNIIQSILLRSLSQAVYSPDNIGHFGLAYPAYCHFTSPIRRYPDLLVHRQIRSILRNQWGETEKAAANTLEAKEALASLGDYSSMTERRADDATRDAVRWLKCEYIQKHIGEEFDGIISGVTRFGFFVELKDIYIDGLIHVTSLRNDFYAFDQIHHRLMGERSGIIFKLGDSVRVRVGKVSVDERKIDFDLIDQNATTKGKSKERARKGKFKAKTDEHTKDSALKSTKKDTYHGKETKAHKEKEEKKARLAKRSPKPKGKHRNKPKLKANDS